MDRKPSVPLTCAEALKRVRSGGREDINAGMVLQLRRMLNQRGVSVVMLCAGKRFGGAYVYEVLALKKYPTLDWWQRVADFLHVSLGAFVDEACRLVSEESDPVAG